MQVSPAIQYLANKEIDKARWDDCIKQSPGRLIYARTFYLDNMAAGWDALIGENYDWVFPVTHRRKFGISYLYQPAFTQQLGFFSKPGVVPPYRQAVEYLQHTYKFWEVNWNYQTIVSIAVPPIQTETATNFILNLSTSYQQIAHRYHNDLRKNLKKSNRFKHTYRVSKDFSNCVELYKEHYGKRMLHVKENDYENFLKLCQWASKNDMLVCREAVDESDVLMASALLLFDGNRLYNLMNTTTKAGRKTGANHILLDAIIQEFSGREIIFDFEGSDLPGVKSFYENFGTVNQAYFMIKYNNLSWPVKLFKK